MAAGIPLGRAPAARPLWLPSDPLLPSGWGPTGTARIKTLTVAARRHAAVADPRPPVEPHLLGRT
ncbi:hypothetical protein MC885_013675 [Smutsia gigantea]|nr:hypothetical protein MC885_013675 [Smutsia gigantea]